MGVMRTFRDADFNEYRIPWDQEPLRRDGHKALWVHSGTVLATWDSYVIGQADSQNAILTTFNRITTVGEAMQAYREFKVSRASRMAR